MVVPGRVQNGVIVLEGDTVLLEGAVVTVSFSELPAQQPAVGQARIQVPLVRTGQPASMPLTGERIAEIVDEEDAAP